MNDLDKEKAFFHFIADAVISFVAKRSKTLEIATHKKEGDFATEVDVAVENLIVDEIKKRFPDDTVLAEEMNKDTQIGERRIWIIDPICGTNNLARGIQNFCTNIALAENNKLIASCVIDHSRSEYYWSIGDKKVFINDIVFAPEKRFDTYVEIDYGAVVSVNKQHREKHNNLARKLVTETNYYLISLNSSLGFAYIAIGKVDAVVNVSNNPWDVCASMFLIQQSGGTISDLSGREWHLNSKGLIAANTKALHQEILRMYLES